MENPVAKAVLDTGVVDEANLAQLRKWGLLHADVGDTQDESAEAIVAHIQEALDSPDMVEMRDTDLDAATQFLNNRVRGTLCIPSPEEEERTVSLPVEYCVTELKEYVLPYKSEGIQALLTDNRTYLRTATRTHVHFEDVRELFFGEHKAFLVCTARK
jgi:hypothetical protein